MYTFTMTDSTVVQLTEGVSAVRMLLPPEECADMRAYDIQISGINREDLDIWVTSDILSSFERVSGSYSDLDGLIRGSLIYFFPRKTAEITFSCTWRDPLCTKKDQ